MAKRPHSILELAEFAKESTSPNARSIKDWLRTADALRKQGAKAKEAGDIQGAFVYYARSATIIVDKIPHHRSYHEITPTQQRNLAANGQDILHSMEQLKPKIADKYDAWVSRDPKNATAPPQLDEVYGETISRVVVSRSLMQRQDSNSSDRPLERPNGTNTQAYHPQRHVDPAMEDLARRVQKASVRTRSGDEEFASSHGHDYDPAMAARRQWQRDQEMEARRRANEENRSKQQQQDPRSMAMHAARQAAEEADIQRVRAAHSNAEAVRQREKIARAAAAAAAASTQALHPPRPPPQHDRRALMEGSPLHYIPAQNPQIFRDNESISEHGSEAHELLWSQPSMPVRSSRNQSSFSSGSGSSGAMSYGPPLITTSPMLPYPTPNAVQYPNLMSPHQQKQGYLPSTMPMYLVPQLSITHQAGGGALYNVALTPNASAPLYPVLPPHPQPIVQPQMRTPPSNPIYIQYPSMGITTSPASIRSNKTVMPSTSSGSMPTPPIEHRKPRRSSIVASYSPVEDTPPRMGDAPRPMRPIDVPVELLAKFLDVAQVNTNKKKETCGLLLGRPRGSDYILTTLLIPEQRSTSDTCTMESEELVVEFQTTTNLITLGWIHTHPTQSCERVHDVVYETDERIGFMSSLDLHTHSGYQSMLPEAIAIVCAPNSDPKFGIFRLTDPTGIATIINCQEKEAFHPHPDLPIYTDADGTHVKLLAGLPLEIVDLRSRSGFSSSEGTRS